jgi:hypothetical protein
MNMALPHETLDPVMHQVIAQANELLSALDEGDMKIRVDSITVEERRFEPVVDEEIVMHTGTFNADLTWGKEI